MANPATPRGLRHALAHGFSEPAALLQETSNSHLMARREFFEARWTAQRVARMSQRAGIYRFPRQRIESA